MEVANSSVRQPRPKDVALGPKPLLERSLSATSTARSPVSSSASVEPAVSAPMLDRFRHNSAAVGPEGEPLGLFANSARLHQGVGE